MRSVRMLTLCWMGFISILATAQSVQISIIPGSEYTMARRDEWKLVVNNTSNQILNVFFRGVATEAQRGKVYEALSKARPIPSGLSTFSTNYYVGLDPFNTLYEDQSLRQYAIQTNGLPAGDYEICITAYLASDSSEIGSNCYSFSADYFTPPILIAPDNNDTVCETYPYFSWLPPVPNNGQNFTYTLTLYELQNMQTVLSSVQTNPAFYERKGITTTIAQYGINARNLRPGYRYAWKVSAEVNNQMVATSDVWSFVYCDSKRATTADTVSKKKEVKNLPKPGIPYLETTTAVNNNFSTLDRGLLSFLYVHSSKTPTVGMRILDMKGNMVFSKLLEVSFGNNYFSAPLTDYKVIQAAEQYELQIVDMNGAIKKLRFKVKP
ncbi:MAG: hypothetical protein IPH78_05055 [Bacteroidetes bacterium]|nr:hypothetical protein [Bacteroidota bacterium]